MIDRRRDFTAFLLVLLAVLPFAGCGSTAQIGGDDESLAAIDALYTAVTSRRSALLEQSVARIETLHSEGKLSQEVHEALQPITARAKKGEWQQAARDLHRFIQAQRRER
jgi:uncharacterized protein with gpF-like domain